MQQAAQDNNYFYDSSWFPWDEVSKEYLAFGDQRAADEAQQIQEGQPGLPVFRRGVPCIEGRDLLTDLFQCTQRGADGINRGTGNGLQHFR